MPLLFYTPDAEQVTTQSQSNNQGRSADQVGEERYEEAVRRWESVRHASSAGYEWLAGQDIARELARIDLPLSTYTQWYWKIDLHNLLHFLSLRVDPHAQWEIQQYGRVMAGMLERVAPLSYEAWLDYQVGGSDLSRMELDVLRRLLVAGDGTLRSRADASVSYDEMVELGLSRREVSELLSKLKPTSERPSFSLDLGEARSASYFEQRFAEAVPNIDRHADAD